jgi:beta-glucosidase
VNELRSYVDAGYRSGVHAPGLKLDRKELAQVAHYAVLGHGMAVEAIRAHAKPGTKVGFADNPQAATPVIETPEHIAAAERAMREENAMFGNVIFGGGCAAVHGGGDEDDWEPAGFSGAEYLHR